jgi:hypothetical protein
MELHLVGYPHHPQRELKIVLEGNAVLIVKGISLTNFIRSGLGLLCL